MNAAWVQGEEGPARKQVKLETGIKAEPAISGSGLGTATSVDTEGQEGGEEEEYKLPPVCQEHVLNLATRMIVLVGDMAHKDEYQA